MTFRAARSVAVSLALCAMMLRALLPDGWMPAANAQGAPSFVICSVDRAHAGGADRSGKPPADQRSHAPCAFAAAAPLSPPAAVATAVGPIATVVPAAAALRDDAVAGLSGFRPNAARAPPAHA